jgi:hypothetical protein
MSLQTLALNQIKRNAAARGLAVVLNPDHEIANIGLPTLTPSMKVVEHRGPLVYVKKPIVITIRRLGGQSVVLEYWRPVKMKRIVKDYNAVADPGWRFQFGHIDFMIVSDEFPRIVEDLEEMITSDTTVHLSSFLSHSRTRYSRQHTGITRAEHAQMKRFHDHVWSPEAMHGGVNYGLMPKRFRYI